MDESSEPTTVHDAVGEDFFVELASRFYASVSGDPILRPLYPDDLAESERLLAGFLVQFWGGSTAYSDERGHPRLRMRHVPFVIGPPERDAWFRHMIGGLSALCAERDVDPSIERQMREYFETAAEAMRNA